MLSSLEPGVRGRPVDALACGQGLSCAQNHDLEPSSQSSCFPAAYILGVCVRGEGGMCKQKQACREHQVLTRARKTERGRKRVLGAGSCSLTEGSEGLTEQGPFEPKAEGRKGASWACVLWGEVCNCRSLRRCPGRPSIPQHECLGQGFHRTQTVWSPNLGSCLPKQTRFLLSFPEKGVQLCPFLR